MTTLITLTQCRRPGTLEDANRVLAARYARLTATRFWKRFVTDDVACFRARLEPDGRTWTVHCHVVAHAPGLTIPTLSAMWYSITGDAKIVDVHQTTPGEVIRQYHDH